MRKNRRKIFIISAVFLFFVIALSIWIFIGKSYQEKKTVAVNLQVTEYKNPEALLQVINEMEKRGLKPATIFIGKEIITE